MYRLAYERRKIDLTWQERALAAAKGTPLPESMIGNICNRLDAIEAKLRILEAFP
jgi:hypothetical protein